MLYCGAPGYTFELKQQIQVVLDEIMKQLAAFVSTKTGSEEDPTEASPEMRLKQAHLVLELANQLSSKMMITVETADFLKKLLDVAFKSRQHFNKTQVAF